MKTFALTVLFFLFAGAAGAVAIDWSTVPMPVAAATDHQSITYFHNNSGWHVQSTFCPRINPAVVTGLSTLPCVQTPVVDIANPGGAFSAKLIADAKLTVLASGYLSAD